MQTNLANIILYCMSWKLPQGAVYLQYIHWFDLYSLFSCNVTSIWENVHYTMHHYIEHNQLVQQLHILITEIAFAAWSSRVLIARYLHLRDSYWSEHHRKTAKFENTCVSLRVAHEMQERFPMTSRDVTRDQLQVPWKVVRRSRESTDWHLFRLPTQFSDAAPSITAAVAAAATAYVCLDMTSTASRCQRITSSSGWWLACSCLRPASLHCIYIIRSLARTVSSRLNIPLKPNSSNYYTLPYGPNLPFLIFDIRALWRSALSARVPECQKLKTVG